ncbi:MAG: metallophosphoesterase [Planctomycetes bacterium]|nr:metallophosphoesterase [Planctomycetota bacterium]
MPQPDKLLVTIQQAARAFRATPGRRGHLLRLQSDAEVMVVGDMHGSIENFRLLLAKAELAKQPRRHLILQEVVHGPFRYAGGGDKSHQLLDLVAALKCQYPHRVHFLLGNHELSQWQNQRIGKGDIDQNDLFRDGVDEAYGDWGERIYAAYLELFSAADLAVSTPNRVLISHSLPSARNLPAFDVSKLEADDFASEDLRLGGPVHALVWGRDLSQANAEAFLRKVDADWLVTGHIPCEQGYMVPNDRQIILDAIGAPACYCLFPADRPVTQQELLAGIGML